MKDNSKMDIHMALDITILGIYSLLDNSKMDSLADSVLRNLLLSYLSGILINMVEEGEA